MEELTCSDSNIQTDHSSKKIIIRQIVEIMEEGNSLLEAGVIEDTLRLRLTIFEPADVVNVNIEDIRIF